MNTKKFLVLLLVFVILVSGVTACGSAPKEDASAAATVAAAKATEAAAVQIIVQATQMAQALPTDTPAPTPSPAPGTATRISATASPMATPTAVTAQAPIRTATTAPTQAPTPVTEKVEPQGQRFYLDADGILAMTPPPNSRTNIKCLAECTQTWAITLTHPLQGNAYGYDLIGFHGNYDVRFLHTRGDQQTVLAEWLNRNGWQGGPQIDARPGDVLTLQITAALGASWQPLPVGGIDYGSYSYVTVGTTQEPLPTYPSPPSTPTPTPVISDSAISTAVEIRYGDVITQTIKSPGDVGIYTFDGNDGDIAFIAAAGTADAPWLELQVKLYDPQGKPIVAGSAGRGEYKLAADGRYVLTVRDAGTQIGPYNVVLRNAGPGAGIRVAYGAFINTSITVPGDVHYYSFTGRAGDVVRIAMGDRLRFGAQQLAVHFLGPDRESLGSEWVINETAIIEKNLTASGEYTVKVYVASLLDTPHPYTLLVENVAAAAGTRIAYGDVVTGTISLEGNKDVYVFEGKAGEKPMIEARQGHGLGPEATSGFCPQIEIFDFKGNSLAHGSTGGAESVIQIRLSLYDHDTYIITVERNKYWGVSTGTYTLSLKNLAAP